MDTRERIVYNQACSWNKALLSSLIDYDRLPMRFMNLCLQTSFIPNTNPVSTLLIANAGLGKTSKLERLREFDFVKYTLDITPKILSDFLNEVSMGSKRFLVIPDYIATLGHAKKTVDLTRSIFRGMIEEGIQDIDVFGMTLHLRNKAIAGLISGITPEYFNQNTKVWRNDGFLSRFVPFSYSHSPVTTETVLSNMDNKINTIKDFKFEIVKQCKEPTKTDIINDKIRILTYEILGDRREPPYRLYKQVTALCGANAILRGSEEITIDDVESLKALSKYINRGQFPI